MDYLHGSGSQKIPVASTIYITVCLLLVGLTQQNSIQSELVWDQSYTANNMSISEFQQNANSRVSKCKYLQY